MFAQGTFINDPNATPSELERKREAIRAMLGQYGKARYVGEGIADMFTGIANGIGSARLNKQEREAREQATNQYEDVLGGWNPFGGNISTSGTQTHGAGGAFGDPYGARNTAMASNGGPTNAAAQQMSNADRDILAKTLMAEAGGEGLNGMLAAGAVINNRVGAGGYGDTLRDVIMKPGQFSAWNSVTGYAGGEGGLDMGNMSPSQDAYRAADMLLSGQYEDPTNGATHYYNPAAADPAWGARAGGNWTRIGNHVFGNADAGRGSGGGTVSTQGSAGGGGYPAYTGPAVQDLAQLMANPWLTPEQRSVVAMQLQQAQQASDPMRQIQWQQAQQQMALNDEKLRQMRQPAPGYRQVTGAELGLPGEQAGALFNVGPDGKVSQIGGGGTNISIATGDGERDRYVYGSDAGVPAGWRVDRQTGQASPIPGGPAAVEAEQQAAAESRAQQSAAQNERTRSNVVSETVSSIRGLLDEGGLFNLPEVGVLGSRLAGVNQEATDMGGMLDTLKGMVVFDRLEKLKQASATGASGLGQVTEKEIALLGAQLGALDQSLSEDRIRKTLDTVEGVFSKLSPAAQAYITGASDSEDFSDAPPAPQAPQAQPKRLRYNPETGELE